MLNTEEKIVRFYSAMTDVYRDEDDREMTGMPKMELSTDITDDITAMLLAIYMIVKQATGSDDDLIDFTHRLNKLAIQHIMASKEEKTIPTEEMGVDANDSV